MQIFRAIILYYIIIQYTNHRTYYKLNQQTLTHIGSVLIELYRVLYVFIHDKRKSPHIEGIKCFALFGLI